MCNMNSLYVIHTSGHSTLGVVGASCTSGLSTIVLSVLLHNLYRNVYGLNSVYGIFICTYIYKDVCIHIGVLNCTLHTHTRTYIKSICRVLRERRRNLVKVRLWLVDLWLVRCASRDETLFGVGRVPTESFSKELIPHILHT